MREEEKDKKIPLIILAGPTAVGKTALSVELAGRISGEIISADSMQVYRGMDIGTAKIRPEEMCGIKHFLIDEFEPDEEFNVTVFKERAAKYISEIASRGHVPILVGGTGFYIQAVARDIDFTEHDDCDGALREQLYREAEEKGADYLFERLREVDEPYAQIVHRNNIKKVIRALEYYQLTGRRLSEHNSEQQKKESPYNIVYMVLTDTREALFERIEQRVDKMFEQGLEAEVKGLLNKGYKRELVSMQGLGYKETAAYLCGECTKEEAAAEIKRGTKHFAKRQLTWFKREGDVIWVDRSKFENDSEILEYILRKILLDKAALSLYTDACQVKNFTPF